MTGPRGASTSPLSIAATSLPTWLPSTSSIGGRIAGILLALSVAADESYDRTQVFAVVLAGFAMLSLVPLRGGAGTAFAALAAGALFFSGAALWSLPAGILLTVAGALAVAGAGIAAARSGRTALLPAAGFLGGLGVVLASVVVIALGVDG